MNKYCNTCMGRGFYIGRFSKTNVKCLACLGTGKSPEQIREMVIGVMSEDDPGFAMTRPLAEWQALEKQAAELKAVIQELIDPAWTTSFNSDWNTTDCIWCGAIRRISGWAKHNDPIWEEIGHREDCPVTKAKGLLGPDAANKIDDLNA